MFLRLFCLAGVLGAEKQRCDLIGSLQCLKTFSSSHKFQVSSYVGDYNVNPENLVTEICTYVILLLNIFIAWFW